MPTRRDCLRNESLETKNEWETIWKCWSVKHAQQHNASCGDASSMVVLNIKSKDIIYPVSTTPIEQRL